jgi:hypothetical protein
LQFDKLSQILLIQRIGLSAKNPNAPIEPPLRHTQEILAEMKILDTESAEIIKVIKE